MEWLRINTVWLIKFYIAETAMEISIISIHTTMNEYFSAMYAQTRICESITTLVLLASGHSKTNTRKSDNSNTTTGTTTATIAPISKASIPGFLLVDLSFFIWKLLRIIQLIIWKIVTLSNILQRSLISGNCTCILLVWISPKLRDCIHNLNDFFPRKWCVHSK